MLAVKWENNKMIKNFKEILQIFNELNFILDDSQKKRAIWVVIVIVLSAGFELLGVTAVLPFVESVVAPEKMMRNKYIIKFGFIFDINNPRSLLLLIGIGLILVYLVKNIFLLYANYIQVDFCTRVQKELSVRMLHSYMDRPYTYFLNTNTSEILRGCSNDVGSVYNIIDYLSAIISQILTVIFIGFFLVYTDPVIAMSVLFLMFIVLMGIVLFFRPAVKKAGRRNIELTTVKSKTLIQAVNGIKDITVMQRKKMFLDIYEDASNKLRKTQRMYAVLNASPDKIVEGICVSGIIGIVCARLMVSRADMISFIPELAAFAVAAFKILPSIGKLANRMTGIMYSRPGMSKVYQNMQAANKYMESIKRYAADKIQSVIYSENLDFQDKLEIKHVFWQYENQTEPVLTNATLTIRKGEAIALIGASGAGKTTLADVILGLLQPDRGSIEMDGIDVYSIPLQWAHIVGYVPQTAYLIDDTVRNNIAFGIPTELIDDEYIWEALEKAQLKEFIEKMPKGLDTIVGERGVKLSGGQCQRISIARALYNQPSILVLDEATASLDNETENAVMDSIDVLQGQLTLIIIAHRLTTIRNCDKIYEIKNGEVFVRSKQEILD